MREPVTDWNVQEACEKTYNVYAYGYTQLVYFGIEFRHGYMYKNVEKKE